MDSVHVIHSIHSGGRGSRAETCATTKSKLDNILKELKDEYLATHKHPWIIGYSGGKDSTLVTHLAIEMVMGLASELRIRDIHIVSNDTLVESPPLMEHIDRNMGKICEFVTNQRLPIRTVKTKPEINQTFWVNLIGRGYASPNQNFRWCTDRMKIRPTSQYILKVTANTGKSILLLGVRTSESSARARTVRKFSNGGRLHPHGTLQGCQVFRPILNLDTEEVWQTLLQRKHSPWDESYRSLFTLYRNADGGECPTMTDSTEAAGCGTSSARFGCWTCTVVEKDRSLSGMIAAGIENLEPLLNFRDWLVSIRNDPNRRMVVRRNGQVNYKANGDVIPGPYTLRTRMEILEKLENAQKETGMKLVTNNEISNIKNIWYADILK